MTSTFTGIVFCLGAIVASDASRPSPGSWEKLYETRSSDAWISAVWLARDGSWRAGGPGFIVSGAGRDLTSTDLGGFHVSAFGEDAAGMVIAVGDRQAIWEETAGGWKRVHERAGPAQKGRAAHEDVLEGIGYVDPDKTQRLVAYGSLHLAFGRGSDGQWQPAPDDEWARLGTLGPPTPSPPGCHVAGWHWLDRGVGFVDCHEGDAFLYRQGGPLVPLGRLPRPCQTTIAAVSQDEGNLFIACGNPARLWQRTVDAPRWSPIPGASGVRALKARGRCLLIGTRRAVLRRCD